MQLRRSCLRKHFWTGLVLSLAAVTSSAQAPAKPRKLVLKALSADVGRFERIAFAIDAPPVKGNVFDAEQIDLHLEITTPDGETVLLPAFYDQPHERRDTGGLNVMKNWLYPFGPAGWRARFAPMQLGRHQARAVLVTSAGRLESAAVSFECKPSDSRGFVRVSKQDSRFFAFDDGTPYFPVGMNIAFVKNLRQNDQWFAQLARGGGNYARVWACCKDWGMSIEGRKSAFGRSWTWDPPIAYMPGRDGFDAGLLCIRLAGQTAKSVTVRPSHSVAVRPSTKYVLTARIRTDDKATVVVNVRGAPTGEPVSSPRGWQIVKRELTTRDAQLWLGPVNFRLASAGEARIRGVLLTEAGGGPNLLWEADANRPPIGVVNLIDAAMLDAVVAAAEREGIRLQLVFLVRDNYMQPGWLKDPNHPRYDKAIRYAKNMARYFVARWGYSTAVLSWEYWNEMDPRLPCARFYTELGEYFEQIDPYRHLRSTSTWFKQSRDWRDPKLDQADLHAYMRPDAPGQRGRRPAGLDEVQFVLNECKGALEADAGKPVLLSEFGLNSGRLYPSLDKELIHFHNTMWASALSGLSGSAMPWWWDTLDAMGYEKQLAPLAKFVADIPFPSAKLRRVADVDGDGPVRYVGLVGPRQAYLWVYNPKATWLALQKGGAQPKAVRGATVTLTGLADGDYAAQWYDTRQGKTLRTDDVTVRDGAVRLAVPEFTRDLACKLIPRM